MKPPYEPPIIPSLLFVIQSGSKKLSESIDLKASLIEDVELKKQAADLIRKKYGMMAKMIMKGPDENRAIIRLEEKGGEK